MKHLDRKGFKYVLLSHNPSYNQYILKRSDSNILYQKHALTKTLVVELKLIQISFQKTAVSHKALDLCKIELASTDDNK